MVGLIVTSSKIGPTLMLKTYYNAFNIMLAAVNIQEKFKTQS